MAGLPQGVVTPFNSDVSNSTMPPRAAAPPATTTPLRPNASPPRGCALGSTSRRASSFVTAAIKNVTDASKCQARTSSITCPSTSVSRRSMPLW